jgi:cytochrome c biogenesis protein CcmG, thiol:disulfide interchange protein DsbE
MALPRSLLLLTVSACHGAAPPSAPPPPRKAPPPVAAPNVQQQPAFLGVRFEPGTTRATQIVDRSPAAAAGLQVDDQIVSLDGVAMQTSKQIVETIAATKPGSTVTIVLERGQQTVTLAVKLVERPPDERLIRETLLDRPAPAFTAPSLDGTASIALADLRGQVVLVDFWATWCGPCTAQFPHLNQWHAQYADKGLRIVALSDEEAQQVRDYVAEQKLAYPIALDPNERIRAAYLVPGIPTTVVIDKAGIVRYVRVGVGNPVEVEATFTQLLK